MSQFPAETIASLLLRDIPRDLVMGVEDALFSGAVRGTKAGEGMANGHKPHVVGQMRHFHMNEAFWSALHAAGAEPTPIKGNQVIVGRCGVFRVGRFNVANGIWNNGKRSRSRREMALANRGIEPLVRPDLFEDFKPVTQGCIFFVGVFDRACGHLDAKPISIDVAVPDHRMESWLFRMSTTSLLALYDAPAETQPDLAVPTLKTGVLEQPTPKTGS